MSSISEGTPYNLGFACLEARVSSDRREGWSSQKGGALQDRGGRSDGPERGPVAFIPAQEWSAATLQDSGCFPRLLRSGRRRSCRMRGAAPGLSFLHVAPPSLLPKSIFSLWSAFGFLQATACPLPLAVPHVTPRKDPGWAAPLPPKSTQLGAAWVALGVPFANPGSEQWAGGQSQAVGRLQ